MNTYIKKFRLLNEKQETDFIVHQNRTCYNGIYPYNIFPLKGLRDIHFEPITIFYGGNGSGKTTLLNIIAEKAHVIRHSVFNSGVFFDEYVEDCMISPEEIPGNSQILTSDDVFDYVLNIRSLNNGLDIHREDLFKEFHARYNSGPNYLRSLDDYDDWKETCDAQKLSGSQFVRERLMRNVDLFSNGESAMRYFVEHIRENAVYLLDSKWTAAHLKGNLPRSFSLIHSFQTAPFLRSPLPITPIRV